MWQAHRETGLGHFVPFWTRYVDAFRRAREIVESGTLGAIKAFVFPGLRDHVAGRKSDHSGLDDGYRVQLFIDAAALAARRGGRVEIAEIEDANNGLASLGGGQ